MPRDVTRSRLLLVLLIAATAVWLYLAGALSVMLLRRFQNNTGAWETLGMLGVGLGLMWLAGGHMLSRLPAAADNARMHLHRVVAVVEFFGGLGLFIGAAYGYGGWFASRFEHELTGSIWLTVQGLVVFGGGSVLVPALASWAARGRQPVVPDSPRPFFWLARGHVSDDDARIYSLSAAAFNGLVLAGLYQLMPSLAQWSGDHSAVLIPNALYLFGLGFLPAVAATSIQFHWHRAIGFIPWSWLLLVAALVALAISPTAQWPLVLLGVSSGLMWAPSLTGILAAAPAAQRLPAILVMQALSGLAAAGLAAFLQLVFAPTVVAYRFVLLTVLAVACTIGFTYRLFRPFVEQINEVIFRVLWHPVSFGPGKYGLPTRGPALIIGNHAAMFDPVWLFCVLPQRSRAMMISTVLDKPFLKWLCGRVYEAIRVHAEGFRRVAPEIDEAVAALKRGESVMIFPESFLRRKEEQPLRRFANGVHRILSQCPDTPVITCWIEDGWGSMTSWKNGPPGKNKPKDFVKLIRVGINELEVLPPEMVKDNMATRRHLMERVLLARTHIGLPAHPMLAFGGKDENGEKDE